MNNNSNTNYKSSGVDVNAGYEAVELMKGHVAKTFTKGVLSSIGGFGGLFQLDKDLHEEPVLVSGTDGVGTKLKIAFDTKFSLAINSIFSSCLFLSKFIASYSFISSLKFFKGNPPINLIF